MIVGITSAASSAAAQRDAVSARGHLRNRCAHENVASRLEASVATMTGAFKHVTLRLSQD